MTQDRLTRVYVESRVNHRRIFLSSLGLIQLIAYWSYYIQFPGLLSSSGIDPVYRLFPYAAPYLHREWIYKLNVDEDAFCELSAVFGMLVSALIASGACQHALLFATNLCIYTLLVRTGGTFYSFQWDILLLETTLVTCLTWAPWQRLRPSLSSSHSPVASIPLQFLLFKLMYMSGIVKVQANCPTWLQLTALEYHLATQCLPGPLAWHFHQFHPLLLQWGVAVTLWLEIPATVLLLIPITTVRRTGVVLQVILQLLIILTGNYNFFNLLTMALCIPVWDDNSSFPTTNRRPMRYHVACWVYLSWTFYSMFRIEWIRIELLPDGIHSLLPVVPYGTLVWVVVAPILHKSNISVSRILHITVCFMTIGVMSVPFSQIQPDNALFSSSIFGKIYGTYARPYSLINGYGLFRRMTGVGNVESTAVGWNGLPPSVVARPEIILEGVYQEEDVAGQENDEIIWKELSFRWKPGNVTSAPLQIAPHQPRLDWQMWFAALGSFRHNPWFIHLMKKLLDGCEPVMDLLGTQQRKVHKIRAQLYHYDFTRVNTSWSGSIPGVEILPGDYWSTLLWRSDQQPVWSRTRVQEYMPSLDKQHMIDFLKSQGYKDICIDKDNPCKGNKQAWCLTAAFIRRHRLYLVAPIGLCLFLASQLLRWCKGNNNVPPPLNQGRLETLKKKKSL